MKSSLSAGTLVICLTSLALQACGDKSRCYSHAQTYCHEEIAYWVDSCGDFEELRDNCECGCADDHSDCRRCGCTCWVESDCCDGCVPINENFFCQDGDPDTLIDVCQGGVCAGWNPSEMAQPALPAEPEPVRLRSWTCPEGWDRVEHGSLLDENGDPFSWCEPPPVPRLRVGDYVTSLGEDEQEGDRPVCEPEVDGAYPVPGRATCRPLGDPCPEADWPDVPAEVAGNRIYAKAGTAGGDGSRDSPFGTVGEAVAAAAAGDVVVIAGGVYAESVTVDKDLTLWGSCIQRSVIDAPGPFSSGAVVVSGGAEVSIRNLRISGAQNGVRVGSAGTSVTLRGVWVHEATGHGVYVAAADARIEGVLVDSTRADDGGEDGIGLGAWQGARVRVESSTLERNRAMGVLAISPGTAVVLEDVAVRGTLSRESDSRFGRGLNAQGGARVTCARGLFDGNRDMGVAAASAGTTVELEDVAVVRTRSRELGRVYGRGLNVTDGAQVSCRQVLLGRNRDLGILASDDTVVELADVVVRDTLGQEDSRLAGRGLEAKSGARVTCRRGLFEENRDAGIVASMPGTCVDLQDVAVRETRGRELDLELGQGLIAWQNSEVTCTRGLFEGNRMGGIYTRDGAVVRLEDMTVRDTLSQESDHMFGRGMDVYTGARATCRRVLFEGNRQVAVIAGNPETVVELEDVTVRDTRGQEADFDGGGGLDIQDGARVTIRRGLFERNRETGILAISGSVLDMEDVTVRDTLSHEVELLRGTGLEIHSGARATCKRGLYEGNRLVGVLVASEGTVVEMEEVTIRETRGQEADLSFGRGLNVQQGARVTVTRGLIEGNHEVGVAALVGGTNLSLDRVIVRETSREECASLPSDDQRCCEGFGSGTAVGIYEGAETSVAAVDLTDSDQAGLQLARMGTLSGWGLCVRVNPIGVNIQDVPEDYDFLGAVTGLLMEGNQVNFDSKALPVPEIVD